MESQKDLGIDIDKVRKEAASALECGAVTPDYALDPKTACQVLNQALASEILCVLRYRHHQIVAKGIDYPQVAAEFEEHADDETVHMMRIADRINQLGGDPDFNPATVASRATTQFGSAADLYSMITDDLVAERVVVEVYRKMIDWFGAKDPTTRRLLEDVLKDEEDHADDLADLLVRVERRKDLHS